MIITEFDCITIITMNIYEHYTHYSSIIHDYYRIWLYNYCNYEHYIHYLSIIHDYYRIRLYNYYNYDIISIIHPLSIIIIHFYR